MKVELKVNELDTEKMQHLINTEIIVRTNPKSRPLKRKGYKDIKISNPVLVVKDKKEQQQYLLYSVSGKICSLGSGTKIIVHT